MSYQERDGQVILTMSRGIFRFHVGQIVWVRDYRWPRGYKIEQATVRECHEHAGRHPWYPNGEGYSLDGQLWWDCYPGCRVFATREEALKARLPKNETEAEHVARIILNRLNSGNRNYTPYQAEEK
jgi:hypothetical protein